MPLVYVQRYAPANEFIAGGTQYVDGVLTFAGPTTIYLSNAVFGSTGDYVLFDYSGGSFPGGQAALNANVTMNSSNLLLSSVGAITDDPTNKRITITLLSKPTNGCQFVDGVLTISNPIDVYLSSTLYATSGTYTLFDWSGGGSFTGSASNITLHPPGGLNVAVSPYVDGNTIKFTLV
jgi:hypothetical protein